MPETKEKKKLYQRWWFWVIICIVTIGIIGNLIPEKTSPSPPDNPNTANNSSQENNPDDSAASEQALQDLIDEYMPVIVALEEMALTKIPETYKTGKTTSYVDFKMISDSPSFSYYFGWLDLKTNDIDAAFEILKPIFETILDETEYPVHQISAEVFNGNDVVVIISFDVESNKYTAIVDGRVIDLPS